MQLRPAVACELSQQVEIETQPYQTSWTPDAPKGVPQGSSFPSIYRKDQHAFAYRHCGLRCIIKPSFPQLQNHLAGDQLSRTYCSAVRISPRDTETTKATCLVHIVIHKKNFAAYDRMYQYSTIFGMVYITVSQLFRPVQ
jgi:hypothetical protein